MHLLARISLSITFQDVLVTEWITLAHNIRIYWKDCSIHLLLSAIQSSLLCKGCPPICYHQIECQKLMISSSDISIKEMEIKLFLCLHKNYVELLIWLISISILSSYKCISQLYCKSRNMSTYLQKDLIIQKIFCLL